MTNRTRFKDEDLNAFARSFVRHVAERATGADEDSRRLVYTRPSDHVLTGFLTPVDLSIDVPDAPEDVALADLPQDAPYEQTNLGLRWLVPRRVFEQAGTLNACIELAVYVRRLPTFHDQQRAPLSVPRPRAGEPVGPPRAEAVPVWTREDLGAMDVAPVSFSRLLTDRRVAIPLRDVVARRLETHDIAGLYPFRRPLIVEEADVATPGAFTDWLGHQAAGSWPLEWAPVLDLRIGAVPTQPEVLRLAARILNRTTPVKPPGLEFVDPNLYGARLKISIPAEAHCPTVFRELPQSYRYNRSMDAVGINAQALRSEAGGRVVFTTAAVPIYESPRLEARSIVDALPEFEVLARDPIPTLGRILEEMAHYDSTAWATKVRGLASPQERQEAEGARAGYRDEIERFRRGVELLANPRYPHVLEAFRLMNQAMGDAARGRFTQWHLFQLVFIVSQIPMLAGREYPELATTRDTDVDILWFAAGGGKTEAFLGVILWEALFDRLRGKTDGVTALVRFPLRLLTFQQLQRLANALAAADRIRERDGLGGAPFSMGYFVGNSTTPNRIDDERHQRYRTRGLEPRLRRLHACPYCGAETEIGYEPQNRLIVHRCKARAQGCPYGARSLPVYVVDYDIYRYRPTIIVSTVDKLAQFGQNPRFAQLFGRVTMVCPEHGASFLGANELCPVARELDRGSRPTHCGSSLLDYGPFHDPEPSLLIQDEMHLLTEELGTFDAHYETAVATLAESLGGRPWKVIAATATIEKYEDHVAHLYLCGARQFPGPGPAAYESFYFQQSSDKVGRIFVGLLGVGRKHTPAVSRALALLYIELQYAREVGERDWELARRRYGIGDMDRATFRHLVFLYEVILTYVLTRKGSDQVAEAIDSRVRQDIETVAPDHGTLRVAIFNGGASEAEMSDAVREIRDAVPQGAPSNRVRGVVATNVIGHGVDVDRFNVMLFAGFPRLVAEYIQASARVGRSYPGVSVFVATPQSERDRSIFDRFEKFHAYVDRLVDPSAITRWPEPAARRTVPGILAGYLMGVAAASIGRRLATDGQVNASYQEGHEVLLQDAVAAWMTKAYRADHAPSGGRYRERIRLFTQRLYSTITNPGRVHGVRPQSLQKVLGAMQSLRDTDDPAYIEVRQEDVTAMRRVIRG